MSEPRPMALARRVERELLPELELESIDSRHPVVPHHVPAPWQVLGAGNYAAVLTHPDEPELAVKVYAPGRPGLKREVEVYARLGPHPAYSRCLHAGDRYLILERLRGVTLWEAVHRGMPIPERVIRDIDAALDYARERGLRPHDVHGRNVMIRDGHGVVVDVSDFLAEEECSKWRDLKRAYYLLYRPVIGPLRLRVPYALLDAGRHLYRRLRRVHQSD